ncbi:MAG: SGNH/GDSL hydrolase family protein [Spirochaetales bacterium]|nr:SGNH/GDSL hydrolase family protein [Spirochaetales bacterium]
MFLNKRKKIVFICILTCLTLTITFFTAEIFIRIAAPVPLVKYSYSPTLKWEPVPNSRFSYFDFRNRKKSYSNVISYNSNGCRGKERVIPKPDNIFRIVCLGDSFTEALQVPENTMYTTLLENLLNNPGGISSRTVEVVNLGISGQGIVQHYINFIERGMAYEPDLVIEQLCINDFIDDETITTAHLDDSTHNVIIVPEKKNFFALMGIYIKDFLKNNSVFYNFIQSRFILSERAQFLEEEKEILLALSREKAGKITIPPHRLMRSSGFIMALGKKCRERGILFVPFSFVMPPEVAHGDTLRSLYKKMNNPFIEQLSPVLAAGGITLYDFTGSFVEKEEKGEFTTIESDGHWNKTGHEVVAASLKDVLLRITGDN